MIWSVRLACTLMCFVAAVVAACTSVIMADMEAPLLSTHKIVVTSDAGGDGGAITQAAAEAADLDVVRRESTPAAPGVTDTILYATGHTSGQEMSFLFAPVQKRPLRQSIPIDASKDIRLTGTYYARGSDDQVQRFTRYLTDRGSQSNSTPQPACCLKPMAALPLVSGAALVLVLLAALIRIAYVIKIRRSLAAQILLGAARYTLLVREMRGDLAISASLGVAGIVGLVVWSLAHFPRHTACFVATAGGVLLACSILYLVMVSAFFWRLLRQPLLPALKGAAPSTHLSIATLTTQVVVALIGATSLFGYTQIQGTTSMLRSSLDTWKSASTIVRVDGIVLPEPVHSPVSNKEHNAAREQEMRQEDSISDWIRQQDRDGNFVLADVQTSKMWRSLASLDEVPIVHVNRNYLANFPVHSEAELIQPGTQASKVLLIIPPRITTARARETLIRHARRQVQFEAKISGNPAPDLAIFEGPAEQNLFVARNGNSITKNHDLVTNPIIIVDPSPAIHYTGKTNYLARGTSVGGFFLDPVRLEESARQSGVLRFLGARVRVFSEVSFEYRTMQVARTTTFVQLYAALALLLGSTLALGWVVAQRRQKALFVARMHGGQWPALLLREAILGLLPPAAILSSSIFLARRNTPLGNDTDWGLAALGSLVALLLCAWSWVVTLKCSQDAVAKQLQRNT